MDMEMDLSRSTLLSTPLICGDRKNLKGVNRKGMAGRAVESREP
jgi:hypothetical protein